jgi:dipeptidyl aminopeptidase/acylaminoacyl peptidase
MKRFNSIVLSLLVVVLPSFAQVKRPVTPLDCVRTRYLLNEDGVTAIKINSPGSRVAYLVKSPNLGTNDNDVALYVASLQSGSPIPIKLVAESPQLSHLTWLEDGKHIAAMAPVGGHIGVVLFDAESGKREPLVSAAKDVEEYAIDGRGDTVVYTVRSDLAKGASHSSDERADGYRIRSNAIPRISPSQTSSWAQYQIWFQRRVPRGNWMPAAVIPLRSPFDGRGLITVRRPLQFGLSLSPDGGKLLANVADIDMENGQEVGGAALPADWLKSPTYRRRRDSGGLIWVTLLYDFKTGNTTMPFASPAASGAPQWSPDGAAFYVVGVAPVASKWEVEDETTHPSPQKPYHLWRIDLSSDRVESLMPDLRSPSRALLWVTARTVVVVSGPERITALEVGQGGWRVKSEFRIGRASETSTYGDIASNGIDTIVDYQRADVAPELRLYRSGATESWATVRLNPSFDELQFAPAKEFHWTTASGVPMNGSLLIPPDFDVSKRYPLVIQTKPEQSAFVCDAGSSHMPSFAPQPMASQGLVYLSMEGVDHSAQYLTGYPGNIGEAAFYTDVWDSAVQELDRLGIVDSNKVGIIGFSRSGWYTEFALVHGRTHFAAATAADNIQYSLGEYWLPNSSRATDSLDAVYGGPPYGDTLQNWMKFSISFNADKIHTPLLMEAMGNGVSEEIIGGIPTNLGVRYEIVTALNRLHRPVELYYYPNDDHQPEHPRARLASLQRNVDWYRFWLQGYERPNPEDSDQYRRWEELRDLRDVDAKASSQAASPVQ